MPCAYNQDLRWRAIWLAEILGFEIDEVSLLLQISIKTISPYVRKFCMLGHVGCNRQAIYLHSNAPARRARYPGGFATTPRENTLCSIAQGV